MLTNLDSENVKAFIKYKQVPYQGKYVIGPLITYWMISIGCIYLSPNGFPRILSSIICITLNIISTVVYVLYAKDKTLIYQNLNYAVTYFSASIIAILFAFNNIYVELDYPYHSLFYAICLLIISPFFNYSLVSRKIKKDYYGFKRKKIDQEISFGLAGGVLTAISYGLLRAFGEYIGPYTFSGFLIVIAIIGIVMSTNGFIRFYLQKKYHFDEPIETKKSEWLEP